MVRQSLLAGIACVVLAGGPASLAQVAPSAPPEAGPAPADPGAAPDAAAPKPKPKPKPKPAGPTPAQALTVVNASPNTALDIIVTADEQIARLGKPLAPKAQASLKLPKLKGCTVSVMAMFQGGGQAEVGELDVCKEKSIRFTE
jgi:hypothetical protein